LLKHPCKILLFGLKIGKGTQEWKDACIILRLLAMMFKTRVKTQFASKLYTKMKFSYVMDDNKFYTCLLNCHSMGQIWVMAQEITHIVIVVK
jgi:hypothetical protein